MESDHLVHLRFDKCSVRVILDSLSTKCTFSWYTHDAVYNLAHQAQQQQQQQ